jgi:hypothetical protein
MIIRLVIADLLIYGYSRDSLFLKDSVYQEFMIYVIFSWEG